jgi:TPR repeat protein
VPPNSDAQSGLGASYYLGQGVARNYAEAARWFRRAAEEGDVVAQYTIGNMYYAGQGVAQDHAEAAIWYQRAAEQGAVDAQFSIGNMYDEGLGVEQDDVQAYQWYHLAASRFQSVERREAAGRFRDRIALRLSPTLLAQARRLAREWQPTSDTSTPAEDAASQ